MKKESNKPNGITLITLVITIIVLLILAGVSLATLTGQNGILTKATTAKEETKKADYIENLEIIGLSLQRKKDINNWNNQIYMNEYEQEIKQDQMFQKAQKIEQLEDIEEIKIQVITQEGWIFLVTENNIVQLEEIVKTEPTQIHVALIGDTLKFFDTEEGATTEVAIAKENGVTTAKYYGNIQEETFSRAEDTGKVNTPWNEELTMIKAVEFVNEIRPTNSSCYFADMTELTQIRNIENLKTAKITSMARMFEGCSSLVTLDVSKFNTKNVTSMAYLFKECNKITNLNLTNFNTSQVTNMQGMFKNCENLTNLNVSKFNTENVISMLDMFQGCKNLETLNVSNFNTKNVTDMQYVFDGCENLKTLDLSNFDTSNVNYMVATFRNCKRLQKLDLKNFDTSNVTTLGSMFLGCTELKELYCNNFTIKDNAWVGDMFNNLGKLEKLNISKFNLENHTGEKNFIFYLMRKEVEITTNQKMKTWLENYSENAYKFTNIITID